VTQNSGGATKSNELVIVQLSFAQALGIDAALGGEQSLTEWLLAHFQ
jgi:hypothetical protein